MDEGVHLKQHHFRLDGSEMGKIFQGAAPTDDDTSVETTDEAPEGFPIEGLPERPEEFSPGLSPELRELVEAASELGDKSGSLQARSTQPRVAEPVARSKAIRYKK
jgi:Mn-containing catalase